MEPRTAGAVRGPILSFFESDTELRSLALQIQCRTPAPPSESAVVGDAKTSGAQRSTLALTPMLKSQLHVYPPSGFALHVPSAYPLWSPQGSPPHGDQLPASCVAFQGSVAQQSGRQQMR